MQSKKYVSKSLWSVIWRQGRWVLRITKKQIELLARNQNYVCAVCKHKTRKLVVDHCHESLRVRGLLCRQCNALLGMAHDDPNILYAAAKYLNGNAEYPIQRKKIPYFELF